LTLGCVRTKRRTGGISVFVFEPAYRLGWDVDAGYAVINYFTNQNSGVENFDYPVFLVGKTFPLTSTVVFMLETASTTTTKH